MTRYAPAEIALFCTLFGGATVAAAFGAPVLLPVTVGGLLFILNFFRDPDRVATGGEDTIISPADGTVTDIQPVQKSPFFPGPGTRIGIFLSVFDVHVNRVPLAGTVTGVSYKPGKYLDARDPECGTLNEAMDITLQASAPGGATVAVGVRQIAGLIARRIVCPVKVGDRFARGERYGMIKFGSRTEIFLPEGTLADIAVKPGDKVLGGTTVIGRLTAPASAKTGAKR